MRYWLPLFLAVVLAAVAVGRAHPAGQVCHETSALREAAGVLPTEPLHKLGTKRLETLAERGAPACAVEQLAAPGYFEVKQAHDVPESVSGVGGVRAWLTNLGLDITDWVLLVITALLVARTGLAFVLSRRPGIVNVGTVTNARNEKDATDPAITAQIQQRLTEQHLFGATLVPGGGLPEAVATTLKETEAPNAKSLSALVGLIPKLLPKAGVTVDAVMRSRKTEDEPPQGCTITLTDLSSGRVLDTITQWRETELEAADAAAICAIAHIFDRDPVRRRTPIWSRFGERSRKALEALIKGDDRVAGITNGTNTVKRYEEAVADYETALKHDPSNLSVAMKLGAAQEVLAGKKRSLDEQATQMVQAAETYLQIRALWNYAYAPRYRAAIALAACAEHAPLIETQLKALDLDGEQGCRDAANAILRELVDDLRWRHVVKRWLETFYRQRQRGAGTRRYFQRFVNPLGRERLKMRATYEMAKPVVLDEQNADSRVAELLCKTPSRRTLTDWLGLNWQVRYNAACYYSRRAKRKRGKDREDLLRKANTLLVECLRDPQNEITGPWLRRDPDLKTLRNWHGAGWDGVNVVHGLTS
jgi:tetratricopeptide (TPR) repeat protein